MADSIFKKEDIKGITCDSREVRDGYMFVAVKGEKIDGNNFIYDAIERGAKIIVAEKEVFVKKGMKFILVKDAKEALHNFSNEFYKFPFENIDTIGVTGTNGKTTITYLIEAMLQYVGKNIGVIGTVNYRINKRVLPSANTTPGAPLIYKLGAEMVSNGINNCVMEVSSHALKQDRVSLIPFKYAIFTNLTRDHLDYHKNFSDYFDSKLKLFQMLKEDGFAILNRDEKCFDKIKKQTKAKVFSYGFSRKADFRCVKIKGNIVTVAFPEGEIDINYNLIGDHNIYNMLAAFACVYLMKVDVQKIKGGIESLVNVPGRLEKINILSKGIDVYIDYAHTPDGLKKVLKCLNKIPYKRVIVVFGCGGERDKGKRPKMGFAAWLYANYSFITADNTRSENIKNIIADILKGFIFKNKVKVIEDRKEAIEAALNFAKQGDVVLIAGKGHENYQILNNVTIPFSDKDIVLSFSSSLK